MFITNHALAGAVIGRVVRRPALAFGLAVASHIGMDMVLHYGREGIEPGVHFVGRSPFPAAVDRFHGRIQNQREIGGLVEAGVALALVAALWPGARGRRGV